MIIYHLFPSGMPPSIPACRCFYWCWTWMLPQPSPSPTQSYTKTSSKVAPSPTRPSLFGFLYQGQSINLGRLIIFFGWYLLGVAKFNIVLFFTHCGVDVNVCVCMCFYPNDLYVYIFLPQWCLNRRCVDVRSDVAVWGWADSCSQHQLHLTHPDGTADDWSDGEDVAHPYGGVADPFTGRLRHLHRLHALLWWVFGQAATTTTAAACTVDHMNLYTCYLFYGFIT